MSKRNLIIGIGVIALAIAWYAFRPELLFVNKTVNEELPVARPTSMAMSKGTEPMVLGKGDFRGLAHETKAQPRFISSRTARAYSVSPTSRHLTVPTSMSTWSPPKWPRTIPPSNRPVLSISAP